MTKFRFEWDEAKDRVNRRKHGISFQEAARVFLDPHHLSIQDRHEGGEERWQTIGTVAGLITLLVAHTWTEIDEQGGVVEVIRIISARRATKVERRRYENEDS